MNFIMTAQDSPTLEAIAILSLISHTPAVGLLARDDILTWLIRTTCSFNFVSWPTDSLRELLIASAAVSRQPHLPPASLGNPTKALYVSSCTSAAISGSYINALLDISLEHLDDDDTDVLNAALSVLVRDSRLYLPYLRYF